MIKNFNQSQTTQPFIYDLLRGLFIAILFSAFIYLEHYLDSYKLLNTVFALASLAFLLYSTKRTILVSGFFIGLLWFYWVGYSFEYQGVGYMTPIIIIAFGLLYLLFFGLLALTKKIYLRALILFGLSFFEPMDWNWMQIELIFIESYIGIFKYQLVLVLIAITLPNYLKNSYRYAPLVLLVFAFNYSAPVQELSKLKIKLVQTDVKQEKKWLRSSQIPTIRMIKQQINDAIENGYDMIVLPESVFPLFLNKHPILLEELKKLSNKIAIVTGGLLREDGKNYNATYIFQNNDYIIAKKMVLVPFGEYIPLPKFAKEFVNNTFFAGASDFITADKPTDFTVKGEKFRNAICYEATCQELYEGDVKFIIASSNNAWFTPSIEPTLQNLLLRYYGRKNGVTIYHSANYRGTGIIQ